MNACTEYHQLRNRSVVRVWLSMSKLSFTPSTSLGVCFSPLFQERKMEKSKGLMFILSLILRQPVRMPTVKKRWAANMKSHIHFFSPPVFKFLLLWNGILFRLWDFSLIITNAYKFMSFLRLEPSLIVILHFIQWIGKIRGNYFGRSVLYESYG